MLVHRVLVQLRGGRRVPFLFLPLLRLGCIRLRESVLDPLMLDFYGGFAIEFVVCRLHALGS